MVTKSALGGRKSDTLVARLAAEDWGVLSLGELLLCGLTEKEVRGRVAAGQLHRVFHGVYAVGHPGLRPEGRWLAAVKACGPGALLSHACGGMLLDLLALDDRRPHVTVPSHRAVRGITVHRTRSLHPADVWHHKGIAVTSPPRTILDLAATLDDAPVRRLMSRAQSKNLTNHRLLAQQLDRAHGRAGRGRYARVLAARPPATRSELEDRLYDLVLAAGFVAPDVNQPLMLGTRRVIPDLRWPAERLCVEADSREWHDNPQARAEDAERQALLEAHGERVIRVTWAQATAHIAQTVTRLTQAGAPRSPLNLPRRTSERVRGAG